MYKAYDLETIVCATRAMSSSCSARTRAVSDHGEGARASPSSREWTVSSQARPALTCLLAFVA